MNTTPASDLLRAGREHHRAGLLDEAEAAYRRAIESDSTSVDARLNLGTVLIELARLPEATDILGQLVVDHPRLAAGWVQLARAIVPQGFDWEAHGAIARALKAHPDADTLVAASMVQMMMKEIDAAESTCRRALKLAPANVNAWIQLGQILTVQEKTRDAAAAYQRALEIDPKNTTAQFVLAAMGAHQAAQTTAPPEYVRSLFDGIAENFDGLLVGSLRYRTPQLLEKMFSQWQKQTGTAPSTPLVMLDAGCGTGLCGLWLAKYRGQLIGADLSRRMIAESKLRGVYDDLIPGDIVLELEKRSETLDLIAAADVMVYIGDLKQLFTAAASALRAGGVFLLSVESTTAADYLLLPTQRFAHSTDYVHRLAASNGLTICLTEETVLRLEKGADVRGCLMLAVKAGSVVLAPSPGTPGEGWGEGDFAIADQPRHSKSPSPSPGVPGEGTGRKSPQI